MFPKMRRFKNELSEKETYQVLEKGIDGILGTISYTGYPYTVPVNYALVNGKIYFHCATSGHKLDNIKENSNVSFTVVTRNEIIQDEFTTDFQSVILFGKAKLIEPSQEILMELIKKYSSLFLKEGKEYVKNSYMSTQLVEITIEHITGKERK